MGTFQKTRFPLVPRSTNGVSRRTVVGFDFPASNYPGETIRRLDGRIRFRYDFSRPGAGERLLCAVFRCDTALFTASGYGLECPASVRSYVNSPYLHRFSLTAVYGRRIQGVWVKREDAFMLGKIYRTERGCKRFNQLSCNDSR